MFGVEDLSMYTANTEFSFDKSVYKAQRSIDLLKSTENHFNSNLKAKGKVHYGYKYFV
jgi:hypothetical protein